MKRLSAAFGTLLILSSPAFAAPSDPIPAAGQARAGEAPAIPGPDGKPGWPPAPDEARPGTGAGRPLPPRGPHAFGPDRAMMLAGRLAAAETLIGIRSEQLDAWRDYTSALIDLMQPPAPPPPPAPEDAGGKAFAREEQMARRIKERAAKADTLLQAIAALRTKLTDAQLAALGRIDLAPRPPMPPHAGPMEGFGPMRGPGPLWGQGSMDPAPRDGGPMGSVTENGMRSGPGEPGPVDSPDGDAPHVGGPADDAGGTAPAAPAAP